MGTGQLNAFQAYQQFSGSGNPAAVPSMGWDYRTECCLVSRLYVSATSKAGKFCCAHASLGSVELNDTNKNAQYDLGRVRDRGLNNLDLHPGAESTLLLIVPVAQSVKSIVWNIFSAPSPLPASTKFRVQFRQPMNKLLKLMPLVDCTGS